MKISSEDFFNQMLLFFPSTQSEYIKMKFEYGELFETIVVENVFMPIIIELLRKKEDIMKLEEIFDYFEEVSVHGDEYLVNIFVITVLEILGNDKKILEEAKKYMGIKTSILQMKADKALGRSI